MPTKYSEFATKKMNAAGVDFCGPGADLIRSHNIKEAYDQENPLFWVWGLYYTNRLVYERLVKTMMQKLWDEGADQHCPIDPLKKPAEYLAWHEINKTDRRRAKSCHVAFAHGCRILLKNLDGLKPKTKAFIQMVFVTAWIASMNDATGESEKSIRAGLRDYFRSQVTLKEYSGEGKYN